MDNEIFLYSRNDGLGVMLKIGSRKHGRSLTLSDDETLKLAYRLMALASGNETDGIEKFNANH